jgi:hypothetical protein
MDERQRMLESEGLDWSSDKHPIRQMTPAEGAQLQTATFEARVFTECFYYLAGRVRTILRLRTNPIPGLSSFEAMGVRNVRNGLLEHAGQGARNPITVPSFAFGGPNGPVVKAIRPAHQVGIADDIGLYANADEMRKALEFRLRRELGKPDL